MDIYSIDWKSKARKDCEACKGHGVVWYKCRSETCWDSGLEVGPCLKCLESDYFQWKEDNGPLFSHGQWD